MNMRARFILKIVWPAGSFRTGRKRVENENENGSKRVENGSVLNGP